MVGRKRLYEDPMGVYNIRLTGAHAIKARRIGKGNVGQGIRACVEQATVPRGSVLYQQTPMAGVLAMEPNQSRKDRRVDSDRRSQPRRSRATGP